MTPRSDDEIASASRTDDGRKVCATCGEPIDVTERHPVAASVESEDIDVYLFCSEACRNRWGQQ